MLVSSRKGSAVRTRCRSGYDTPEAKGSKQELLGLIEDYRQGLLPLIVPLALLKHHLNRHPVPK